jgi:hypothetical protein
VVCRQIRRFSRHQTQSRLNRTETIKDANERHIIPTARSRDLVHWTYVGDAFTESTLPGWAAPDAALWAPDIRWFDGAYHL